MHLTDDERELIEFVRAERVGASAALRMLREALADTVAEPPVFAPEAEPRRRREPSEIIAFEGLGRETARRLLEEWEKGPAPAPRR